VVVAVELPLPVGVAAPDEDGAAPPDEDGTAPPDEDGAAPPDEDGAAPPDEGGVELVGAAPELVGATLVELPRLAHCAAAASGTVRATVRPQAPITQVVAAF